ncbi:MAG: amidase [Deltaproteobacteria bacterium]|nr:amidase [Deltaproteobacteria bacterium]
MPDDLFYLSATQLLDNYRKKRLSPVEVTRAVLDRIAAYNPKINAFCLVDEETSLVAARESEAHWMKGEPKGLVDGVPVSIKDLVLTKGWPTLFGSKTVDPNQPWLEDAPCVARLREHGAVFIGKTTTPEFGWKGLTDSPLTGITRNPWNLDMTPGGSSGGAAAALAAGMGPLAIGSDSGGSIRIPASFTGVFGLKPSFGRVPSDRASLISNLATDGPITRTVTDAALMLTVITKPDVRDWFALPYEDRDYQDGLDNGVQNLRVAFSPTLGYAKVDSEVAGIVAKAAGVFSDLGAFVDEVDPGFEDPTEMFNLIRRAYRGYSHRELTQKQMNLVDKPLARMVDRGANISLVDCFSAIMARSALGQRMKQFCQNYDLLLTPTLALPPFPLEQGIPSGEENDEWFMRDGMNWTPFSYPFNLTGQPAASIPCGFTESGLPIGLQIVGPLYGDALVLRASRAYELARGELPLPSL